MKLLIDASNVWFRAYTATPLVQPGGAMMIMTNILKKLIRVYGIENTIVVWDGGRSGRETMDSEYKAGRIAVGGLWQDIVHMAELIDYLGIPNAIAPGYEADDAIASLATQLLGPVRIYSNDKDFFQLIDDRVMVLQPGKAAIGDRLIDAPQVLELTGQPPEKQILVKSFKGDVSDNIQKLPIRFAGGFKESFGRAITSCKDVEDFYQRMDDFFAPKFQDGLRAFQERALLNQDLLRMIRNLDVVLERSPPDLESARALVARHSIYAIDVGFVENL